MTSTNQAAGRPAVIFIAGHWLGSWAWSEVIAHLDSGAVNAVAMTLPGFDGDDPDRAHRTLDDQVSAILEAIASAAGSEKTPVVIVGHSGANAPVSIVLDRNPELVQRVVWVDSGPVAPGTVFAPDFPAGISELELPAFEALGRQASLEGLNSQMLERFRAKAVPVPGGVLREPVVLSNDLRRQVPTTLVCCSLLSAQVQELVQAGNPMFTEVAKLEDVDFVDLPTGHWPMWSRPAELAKICFEVAAPSK